MRPFCFVPCRSASRARVVAFDSRNRPISTTQYGNMQLILNAASASSNPYSLVAVEDFALVQTLSMAGSLAAS